jgi:rubrerythrin
MDIGRLVDQGIEVERLSRDYYRQLSLKSIREYAGPALEQLAMEEQKHMDILEEYRRSVEESVSLPDPAQYAAVWKQFTTALDEVREAIQPHSDEITVTQRAIELETRGLELYDQARRDASGEAAKQVFGYLAAEEVRHREYLEDLLNRLLTLYQEPPEARPQL